MGKKWDYDVPSVEVWKECLRVLKPGGHLLAFAGTRTQHRMAVRIEDAGFEIRDMIAWVYGSGFPKSLDVSKAIDKAAGADREVVDTYSRSGRSGGILGKETEIIKNITTPSTKAAKQWQGWGTALKPALEPITVARKPLGEKTVAANVLAHGTGAINVDGCRVGTETITQRLATVVGGKSIGEKAVGVPQKETGETTQTIGRWPANLIHDGSDEVVGLFPSDKQGSASRFFYVPKASKKDRDEGCEGLEGRDVYSEAAATPMRDNREQVQRRNHHPTVKPTALMRYLCRLVTPPEGIVLDPFMGSGSTGKAAVLEGFQFIGVERDKEYMKIAKSRIAAAIMNVLDKNV
jgi:site-specific DNA-methyltransferase (adenine-specific)